MIENKKSIASEFVFPSQYFNKIDAKKINFLQKEIHNSKNQISISDDENFF